MCLWLFDGNLSGSVINDSLMCDLVTADGGGLMLWMENVLLTNDFVEACFPPVAFASSIVCNWKTNLQECLCL